MREVREETPWITCWAVWPVVLLAALRMDRLVVREDLEG